MQIGNSNREQKQHNEKVSKKNSVQKWYEQ